MKKIVIAMFLIGMVLCLLDLDNMSYFIITKLIGIAMMIPAFKLKFE